MHPVGRRVRVWPGDHDAVVYPDGRNVGQLGGHEGRVGQAVRRRDAAQRSGREERLSDERRDEGAEGKAEVQRLHEGGAVAAPQVQAPDVATCDISRVYMNATEYNSSASHFLARHE